MTERTATIYKFKAETSKFFIVRRARLSDIPTETEHVTVGEKLAFDAKNPRYSQFGLGMIWQGDENVLAIFKSDSNLFIRHNGKDQSQKLPGNEQHQVPIPETGLRVINRKTREQIEIRLNKPEEELPISAVPEKPDPTLSASVAIKPPLVQKPQWRSARVRVPVPARFRKR